MSSEFSRFQASIEELIARSRFLDDRYPVHVRMLKAAAETLNRDPRANASVSYYHTGGPSLFHTQTVSVVLSVYGFNLTVIFGLVGDELKQKTALHSNHLDDQFSRSLIGEASSVEELENLILKTLPELIDLDAKRRLVFHNFKHGTSPR